MANITRDHFNSSRGVLRKVLQKGVYLVDADWNEQMDVLLDEIQKSVAMIGGNLSYRIGNGFRVYIDPEAPLTREVTIKAGWGVFKLSDGRSAVLYNSGDYLLTGFSVYSVRRTDYVYIDITIAEIGTALDPDIVSPDLGLETCVDKRISWTIAKSETNPPGTPPDGHYYIVLGTIDVTQNSYTFNMVSSTINDITKINQDIFLMGNMLRNSRFNYIDVVGSIRSWHTAGAAPADMLVPGIQNVYSKFGEYCAKCVYTPTASTFSVQQVLPQEQAQALRGKSIRFGISFINGSTLTLEPIIISILESPNSGGSDITTATIHKGAGTVGSIVDNYVDHLVTSDCVGITLKITVVAPSTSGEFYLDGAYLFLNSLDKKGWEPNILDYVTTMELRVEEILRYGIVPLYSSISESFTSADTVDLANSAKRHTVTDVATGTEIVAVRFPYIHRQNTKFISARLMVKLTNANTSGRVMLTANSITSEGVYSQVASSFTFDSITGTSYQVIFVNMSVTGLVNNKLYQIMVKIKAERNAEATATTVADHLFIYGSFELYAF